MSTTITYNGYKVEIDHTNRTHPNHPLLFFGSFIRNKAWVNTAYWFKAEDAIKEAKQLIDTGLGLKQNE